MYGRTCPRETVVGGECAQGDDALQTCRHRGNRSTRHGISTQRQFALQCVHVGRRDQILQTCHVLLDLGWNLQRHFEHSLGSRRINTVVDATITAGDEPEHETNQQQRSHGAPVSKKPSTWMLPTRSAATTRTSAVA